MLYQIKTMHCDRDRRYLIANSEGVQSSEHFYWKYRRQVLETPYAVAEKVGLEINQTRLENPY